MTTNANTIDIALVKGDDGIYDMQIDTDGDFLTVDNFNTSIQIALGCEKRATEDEEPIAAKRRGWIGNETNDEAGFEIGSKNWQFYQSRNNTDTKNALRDSSKDSLIWLVTDKYLNNLRVAAMLETEGVSVEINLVRESGKIDKLYYELWEESGF